MPTISGLRPIYQRLYRFASRSLESESGGALVLVLAFMALTVPIVTGILNAASVNSIESRGHLVQLKRQYASGAGAQDALYRLLFVKTRENPVEWWRDRVVDSTTTPIVINDQTILVRTTRITNPDDIKGAPPLPTKLKQRKISAEKVVLGSTSTSPGLPITYVITVENGSTKEMDFTKVVDELPDGFSNVPSFSELIIGAGSPIAITPVSDGQQLTWNLPDGTKLQPGETATVTFTVDAASSPGVYCNEVYAEKGGKKTRSGKIAKVTVGSPTEPECKGVVLSVSKTVEPQIVSPNTPTEFTYTIKIENEGTEVLRIKEIKDFLPPELTAVVSSVTSTLPSIDNAKKIEFNPTKAELKIQAVKDSPWEIATGTTWYIEFKTATTTLAGGVYNNSVELKLETRKKVLPTSMVSGSPDVYTYVIEIENDRAEPREIKDVDATIGNDFTYVVGSSTSTVPGASTSTQIDVGEPDNKMKWKPGAGVTWELATGTTLFIEFELETALPTGLPDDDYSIDFKVNWADKDKPPSKWTTGPTASVYVMDVFEIETPTDDWVVWVTGPDSGLEPWYFITKKSPE